MIAPLAIDRKGLLSKYQEPDFGKEKISFDSWKMRIPREMVTVKDDNLTSRWVYVNENTGEVDQARARENVLYRELPGYTVKWGIEKQVTGRKSVQEFLTIGVPAKILGNRYFEGITIDNIELVYKALQDQRVAAFSFQTFIDKSACTDIDLKRDYIYQGDFTKDLREMAACVKPTKKKGKGCRLFTQKDNQGIEFSDRRTTSFKQAPYLKFYHKGVELAHHSPKFATAHLAGVDFHSVIRAEATLKNKKHMRHLFGHPVQSPYLLVEMPYDDKKRVFDHAIEAHMGKKSRPKTKEIKLKGHKLIIYELLRQHLNEGKDFDQVANQILGMFETKQERYRHKKLLNELHELYTANQGSEFLPFLHDVFWN